MQFNYQLTPSQYAFLNSDAEITLFQAGIGSGKTKALCFDIIKHIITYPRAPILLVANSFAQLINSAVVSLLDLLDELNLEYTSALAGVKKHITVLNTVIHLYSLENYELLRGLNISALYAEELYFAEQESFMVALGRLRDKRGSLKCKIASSPNGFNWLWELSQKHPERFNIIKGVTKDNPFLPDSYYKLLLDLYGGEDSKLSRQELFGENVNLTDNNVYFSFNRLNHVKDTAYNPNHKLWIAQDFNIQNMNSLFVQYYDGVFHIFKELKLNGANANTFTTAQTLNEILPGIKKTIIADGTGNARKTSASKTDIQILKDAGHEVPYFTNPLIKNRQNTLNLAFIKNKIVIDSSCKELIKELETLTHKQTEGIDSHLAVCLGYIVYYLDPLKPPQQQSQSLTNPFLKRK